MISLPFEYLDWFKLHWQKLLCLWVICNLLSLPIGLVYDQRSLVHTLSESMGYGQSLKNKRTNKWRPKIFVSNFLLKLCHNLVPSQIVIKSLFFWHTFLWHSFSIYIYFFCHLHIFFHNIFFSCYVFFVTIICYCFFLLTNG